MAGATMSIKGVRTVLPKPILPQIEGGVTREGLIKLHQLISKNVASVASNLGGGHHRHLALIMTREDYTSQMVFPFVLPHNPETHKIKLLELKSSDKIKQCFVNTPPLMEL